MMKHANDQHVKGISFASRPRMSTIGRQSKSLFLLVAVGLCLAGEACTLPEDDIECGTPELPCESIVIDDVLEG